MPTTNMEARTRAAVARKFRERMPGQVVVRIRRIKGSKMKGGAFKWRITHRSRKGRR